MGWASGSELAECCWCLVKEFIPESEIQQVARTFIGNFEDFDCDTIGECTELVKDAGLEAEYWPDEDDE